MREKDGVWSALERLVQDDLLGEMLTTSRGRQRVATSLASSLQSDINLQSLHRHLPHLAGAGRTFEADLYAVSTESLVRNSSALASVAACEIGAWLLDQVVEQEAGGTFFDKVDRDTPGVILLNAMRFSDLFRHFSGPVALNTNESLLQHGIGGWVGDKDLVITPLVSPGEFVVSQGPLSSCEPCTVEVKDAETATGAFTVKVHVPKWEGDPKETPRVTRYEVRA